TTLFRSPDSKEEITLITNQAYAVRFDISEIPTSGSKAVGVKSVNLKDDDYIVNYVLADPKYIDLIKVGIINQRGAFKQLKLNLINNVTCLKISVIVLLEIIIKFYSIF